MGSNVVLSGAIFTENVRKMLKISHVIESKENLVKDKKKKRQKVEVNTEKQTRTNSLAMLVALCSVKMKAADS